MPPPLLALLFANVLLVMLTVGALAGSMAMPPPLLVAVLPEMVLLAIFSVVAPTNSAAPSWDAVLPLSVLLVTVRTPVPAIAPPKEALLCPIEEFVIVVVAAPEL